MFIKVFVVCCYFSRHKRAYDTDCTHDCALQSFDLLGQQTTHGLFFNFYDSSYHVRWEKANNTN